MIRGKKVAHILSLFMVIGMIVSTTGMVSAKHDTIVIAKRGTPTVDGIPGDPEWGPAANVALSLPVEGGGGPDETTVRAAYDDENIYISVRWEDPTKTQNIHKGMWTYHAETASWSSGQNEDRVYLLWNINAPDFGAGCAVYCHVGFTSWEVAETKMGTNNPGDTIDVWHWKATRTNPLGSTDDKYWVDLTNAKVIIYEGEEVKRARLADSGSGFGSSNKDGKLPKYMYLSDPGANVVFLFEHEAVLFDPEAAWMDGDTVPGYVLKEGTGSEADVETSGGYYDGVWVVEFKRKLDTGNPDDAVFDVTQETPFSLGISDNSGHSKNGASLLTLRFE